MKTCESCAFRFVRQDWREQDQGECRRYPPTLVAGKSWNRDTESYEPSLTSRFPDVDADEWCGEHKSPEAT